MLARRTGLFLIAAVGVAIASFLARPAHAISSPSFTSDDRYSSIVVDAESGQVLAAANADAILHPASLTKIMTLYMTFDALKRGEIKLNQVLPVSAHAASMTPTELGLKAGQTITTEQAILGLVTESANDAAVVLAEAVGGTEAEFGRLMTERAHGLGMTQSTFANASGLPNPQQLSSARDMALLAMAMLRDHPVEYRYFSTYRFSYRGRVYFNHNRLLALYKGVDGIKTGFIRDAGYNLVASAQRDGRRVIGVVFGGSSGHARDAHMITLLDGGFRTLATRVPMEIEASPTRVAEQKQQIRLAARVPVEVEAPPTRVAEQKQPLQLAATSAFDFSSTAASGLAARAQLASAAVEPAKLAPKGLQTSPVLAKAKMPAPAPAKTVLAKAKMPEQKKNHERVQMVAFR